MERIIKIFLLLLVSFLAGWTALLQTEWVQENARAFVFAKLGPNISAQTFRIEFPLKIVMEKLQFEGIEAERIVVDIRTPQNAHVDVFEVAGIPHLTADVQRKQGKIFAHVKGLDKTLAITWFEETNEFEIDEDLKAQGIVTEDKIEITRGLYAEWSFAAALSRETCLLRFQKNEIHGELTMKDFLFTLAAQGDNFIFSAEAALTQENLSGKGNFVFEDQVSLPLEFSGNWEQGFQAETKFNAAALTPLLPDTVVAGETQILASYGKKGLLFEAAINNGELQHLESGISIQGLHVLLSGDETGIKITKLEGADPKGGTITATGEIRYPDMRIDAKLHKFHIAHLERAKGRADGNLEFHFEEDKGRLLGNLSITEAKVSLKDKTRNKPSLVDITYVNGDKALPEKSEPKNTFAIDLDIGIVIPDTLQVKGKGLQSVWGGEISVTGSGQNPNLQGKIFNKSGTFEVSGKELVLRQGEVHFRGPFNKTALFALADVEIEGKKIEVVVQGPLEDPQIHFRSNPSMNKQEILSWLLFGREVANINSSEKGLIAQTLSLVSASSSSGPLTKVQKALGVDKIDIGETAEGQTQVKLGKYIGKDTMLSVSRRFSKDPGSSGEANHVGIETRIRGNLRVQAEVSDDSNGQVNLIWKKDY